MSRRLAAAILAVTGAGSLAMGVRPAEVADASDPTPVPVVPAWSARRVPGALADAVGAAKLPLRLHEILDQADACFVMREGGALTFSLDPAEPKIPASVQKLLTGAAALAALGPDHRFETRVLADARPHDGRVERLYLVGGADPVLMVQGYKASLDEDPLTTGHPVTPLEDLAVAVLDAGVREVAGGVTGDASRHTGAPTVATWKPSYITDRDVSYLSALTVNGGWAAWDPVTVTAPDPAAYAASELGRLLTERGVGGPRPLPSGSGKTPSSAVEIAAVTSPPLAEIVTAMLRESDNLIAETLVREIGLARRGVGTTEAGTAAVVEVLAELGIDVSGVALVDGSGLDRGNRATCGAAMGALDLRSRSEFAAIDDGLAVAGRTGTLSKRFLGAGVEGRLRAKTGSLKDVVGLAGVLGDRAGGRPDLTFALLANGVGSTLNGAGLQDAVAQTLDAYPFPSADPAVLAPPPPRAT